MASTIVRLLWFACIGWWAGTIWLIMAVGLMLTIVGFPIGVVMLYKTWKVATLQKDPTVVVEQVAAEATDA